MSKYRFFKGHEGQKKEICKFLFFYLCKIGQEKLFSKNIDL